MKKIRSIMAGTVLTICVAPGEQVSAKQEVLILESMKMAIPIESNETGKITEIKVRVGDFVNENDVLMVIE